LAGLQFNVGLLQVPLLSQCQLMIHPSKETSPDQPPGPTRRASGGFAPVSLPLFQDTRLWATGIAFTYSCMAILPGSVTEDEKHVPHWSGIVDPTNLLLYRSRVS
jgi:hypothetical protein